MIWVNVIPDSCVSLPDKPGTHGQATPTGCSGKSFSIEVETFIEVFSNPGADETCHEGTGISFVGSKALTCNVPVRVDKIINL